jgi:hypothetical protein
MGWIEDLMGDDPAGWKKEIAYQTQLREKLSIELEKKNLEISELLKTLEETKNMLAAHRRKNQEHIQDIIVYRQRLLFVERRMRELETDAK